MSLLELVTWTADVVKTLQQSVVENLEEIMIGVLLALFDADETQSSYAQFITYVILFIYLLFIMQITRHDKRVT